MKIKDSPPGSPARPEPIPTDLSQLSHRLSGQYRTQAHSLDIWRILTCGYGFWRTDRTDGIDLRIRRLGSRSSTRLPASPWHTSFIDAPCEGTGQGCERRAEQASCGRHPC